MTCLVFFLLQTLETTELNCISVLQKYGHLHASVCEGKKKVQITQYRYVNLC